MRTGNGGEDVAVGYYMVWLREQHRGSFLTGPSVRNTRIERLWRDVVESVVSVFFSLFLFMEAQHILDPGSDLDVFVLHYIFLPRIQRFLDRFVQCFNFHSMSTEHNRTPRHLWSSGCLRSYNSPNAGIQDVLDSECPNDLDLYGDDPDAPAPDPDNEVTGLVIPSLEYQLDNEVLLAMETNFDPLSEDNNFGINTYLQAQEFVTVKRRRTGK